MVVARGFSKGGGPYQWFRRYNICPPKEYMNQCENTNDWCCKDLPDGKRCLDKCQKFRQLGEASLPVDTGFYFKFQSDPVTGKPSGCPGFEDEKWIKGMIPENDDLDYDDRDGKNLKL